MFCLFISVFINKIIIIIIIIIIILCASMEAAPKNRC